MQGESSGKTNSEQVYKDWTKPDGDACRPDGTLKDASEMEWPNSPSDLNQPKEDRFSLKRKSPGDENESDSELPKAKVT